MPFGLSGGSHVSSMAVELMLVAVTEVGGLPGAEWKYKI